MKLSFITTFLAALQGARVSNVQSSFLPEPTGLREVLSERWPGATISFKQTTICETTPGVKAWSGYVHLPETLLNKVENLHVDYDINLFFWYFESRHDSANAPTAMYFGGGPGYTSLDPSSGFPCNINADSNSTTLNEFSWNQKVNMLYIEQPVGTGFSYSHRLNGTVNLAAEDQPFTPLKDGQSIPETNNTIVLATMDERSARTTQNTTQQAARTIWQFAQVWFQEFPEHKTRNKEISIWGNSYGGWWGTGFVSNFIDQNKLIAAGKHPNVNATRIPISMLGIENGCIEMRSQAMGFPHLAFNNTYGIEVYGEDVYNELMHKITAPKVGCWALLDQCRALAAEGDPHGLGNNSTVNEACAAASGVCFGEVVYGYKIFSNRSTFDITVSNITSDMPNYYAGFFNQRWVQEDLGVRVNFTENDYTYQVQMFEKTGDGMRRDLSIVEHILDSEIGIAFIYGDRDYVCNWIGVENLTLHMNYHSSEAFRSAGYAHLVTNSSYNGGLVRQHDKVSFSRVFEAGHATAHYQPETVYKIFERSIFGMDVATGKVKTCKEYSSRGPLSSWATKNKVPTTSPDNECYLYVASDTCTPEQIQALEDDTAVIEDFIIKSPPGTGLF